MSADAAVALPFMAVLLWAEAVQRHRACCSCVVKTLKVHNSSVLRLSRMMWLCQCVTAATLYVV